MAYWLHTKELEIEMTLLELLVKELPGRGGWPNELTIGRPKIDGVTFFPILPAFSVPARVSYLARHDFADGHVNQEQYESALAASHKPVWHGEGLPPVGSHVDIVDIHDCLIYGQNESGEVLAHIENTAVVRMSYGLGCFEAEFLLPTITEADRQKQQTIDLIRQHIIHADNLTADGVYDAVASGLIKGIYLEKGDK